jgi:hypothetical protein
MCPVGLGQFSQYEMFLNVFGSSGQRLFHCCAASAWVHPWATRIAIRAPSP